MRKQLLLRLSGRRLVSFFLITALLGVAHISPVAAAESDTGTSSGKGSSGEGSQPCVDPGLPCLKHSPPIATDKYYPYGSTNNCPTASGVACNSPNVAKCGVGNVGTCQTMKPVGGNCSCNCVMP